MRNLWGWCRWWWLFCFRVLFGSSCSLRFFNLFKDTWSCNPGSPSQNCMLAGLSVFPRRNNLLEFRKFLCLDVAFDKTSIEL